MNLPPGTGFEEIATLTPDPDKSWDSDPEAFKEHVRADVCRVGGDLVVTEINAKGFFARGTVLRKVAKAPVTPAAPSS